MSGRTWTLAMAHAGSDLVGGAVPALAAYFAARQGYDLAQVASLILAVNIGSSLVQPALGAVADRLRWRWSAPVGVVLAGAGLTAVGMATSYPLVLAALLVSGFGVAFFHPEGGRLAAAAAQQTHQSRAMSVFALGGNAGFALGPLVATPMALTLGASGIVLLGALPAGLAAPLAIDLWRDAGSAQGSVTASRTPAESGPGDVRVSAFGRLAVVIAFRSAAFYALQALLPALFLGALASSLATANAALSTMLVCGTAATLVGGWRIGRRLRMGLITWPLLVVVAALVLLALTNDPVWGFVLAGVLGVATFAGFSPSVVLGQRYLPGRAGLASGVAFGLAPGVGSLLALVVAGVADSHGLTSALIWLAALPLIALPLAFTLPRTAEPAGTDADEHGEEHRQAASSTPRTDG